MAECMSGLAAGAGAAGAALGLEAFGYNRENFLGDRDQRKEKEFKTMDMRIAQTKQWREDVEDLVSLTEKKMHIYNLTTILLVLITIFLWCEIEDTLSSTTPEWLFCGFALANTGAFMFLLLSIWLVIYSAVVAQGYSVRLRTQMVRLPIPSWQEVEACRTYGSQFEQIEGRQLFRIPFMMGRQEQLAKSSQKSEPTPEARSTSTTENGVVGGGASEGCKGNEVDDFADPWALERRADSIQGLGCPLGADVAKLRHIKMTRQAATLWQTYDSFARVSLSIGINQLILAISYYFLAYLVVDVDCRTAGTFGILVFIVLADSCLKLEMSLQDWQLPVAQFLAVLGPIIGLIAAHQENDSTDLSSFVANWCIPFAFLAHGFYLIFMIYLCRVKVQSNGARVPAAFKQKLYLDAFASSGRPVEDSSERPDECLHKSNHEGPAGPPALDSIRYGSSGPCQTLPQDLAPAAYHDMRFEEGVCDPSKPLRMDSSVEVPFYHWGHGGLPSDQAIVTGHEVEAPGVLPWRIFYSGLTLLAVAWIVASIWGFQRAVVHAKLVSTDSAPAETRSLSLLTEPGVHLDLPEARPTHLLKLWASGFLGSILADSSLELVPTTWSQAHMSPRTLSCDASGNHLLVTDGLLVFTAEYVEKGIAEFEERHCSALVGEGLQDASIACERNGICESQVLHRNGRRVAACAIPSVNRGSNQTKVSVATVSEAWLDRHNATKPEKLMSIAIKPFCKGGLHHCTYVQTSHGRVVQLRMQMRRQELVPADVLLDVDPTHDTTSASLRSTVRAFNNQYLGVLRPHRQSIDLLDSSQGGLSIGKLVLPPTLHATSWCAGGNHLFMLAAGVRPTLWRMKLPQALSNLGR